MGGLTESIVEDAALAWFGEQCRVAPALTPALAHGEREKDEAIRRLSPAISEEARATHKECLSVPRHIERGLTP